MDGAVLCRWQEKVVGIQLNRQPVVGKELPLERQAVIEPGGSERNDVLVDVVYVTVIVVA